MVRHGCGLFQRATIFEIGGDAGGAERVVADLGFYFGARSPPLDYCLFKRRHASLIPF